MGDNDIIEGFVVGGSTQIMIANIGNSISLTMKDRQAETEATLSLDQSRRIRRLLSAAEKRSARP